MKKRTSVYFIMISLVSLPCYARNGEWDLTRVLKLLVLNKYAWFALVTIFSLVAIGYMLKTKIIGRAKKAKKKEKNEIVLAKPTLSKNLQNVLKDLKKSPIPMALIGETGNVVWENMRAARLNSKQRIGQRKVEDNDIVWLQEMKFHLSIQKNFSQSLYSLVYFISDKQKQVQNKQDNSFCLSECLLDVIENYNFIFQTSDIRVNVFEEDWDLRCFAEKKKMTDLMSSFLLATHVLVKDSPKVDTVDLILDRNQQRLSFSLLIHNFEVSDEILHKKIEFKGEQTSLAHLFTKCQNSMDKFSARVFINNLMDEQGSPKNCYISVSFNEAEVNKGTLRQVRV